MRDIDFLIVMFAFLAGTLFGFMVGQPEYTTHPTRPAYTTPITDTLPTMGQP